MLNILKEPDIIALYGDITNYFKLSNRWLYAFMKIQKLSLRRRRRSVFLRRWRRRRHGITPSVGVENPLSYPVSKHSA